MLLRIDSCQEQLNARVDETMPLVVVSFCSALQNLRPRVILHIPALILNHRLDHSRLLSLRCFAAETNA